MKKENTNIKNRAYYQSLKARYLNAAKEASSSGDRVMSEYNLQFAEHYSRVLSEKFSAPNPQPAQSKPVQNAADSESQDESASKPSSPEPMETSNEESSPILEKETSQPKRRCVRKPKTEKTPTETNS